MTFLTAYETGILDVQPEWVAIFDVSIGCLISSKTVKLGFLKEEQKIQSARAIHVEFSEQEIALLSDVFKRTVFHLKARIFVSPGPVEGGRSGPTTSLDPIDVRTEHDDRAGPVRRNFNRVLYASIGADEGKLLASQACLDGRDQMVPFRACSDSGADNV